MPPYWGWAHLPQDGHFRGTSTSSSELKKIQVEIIELGSFKVLNTCFFSVSEWKYNLTFLPGLQRTETTTP